MANIEHQLETLIRAARKVEYYKHFGRHGDGKDLQAQKDLARAKRQIRELIQNG